MRQLEASRRADGQGGLSARTVRYVYMILRSVLSDAVKQGRLSVNPTDRSAAPSPSEARPPEMQAWTAPELARSPLGRPAGSRPRHGLAIARGHRDAPR